LSLILNVNAETLDGITDPIIIVASFAQIAEEYHSSVLSRHDSLRSTTVLTSTLTQSAGIEWQLQA